MLQKIKKNIPGPVKKFLLSIYGRTILQWQKRRLYLQMQKKHQVLLGKIKNKGRIRVVFLAIHKSVWKVDPVFQKMLADPFFDPIILVCPYLIYGEERMWNDIHECQEYFNEKGYPTHLSYNTAEQRWIKLDELAPDIIFFTNPHNLTRKEYYEDAYLSYLSCYVPYHHEAGSYGGNLDQYNQNFHNCMWKIFSSHMASYNLFVKYSQARARNVLITGYPPMEIFFNKKQNFKPEKVWKNKDERLRIIWAPHHTIDSIELPYSNFLQYADKFKNLACKYKDKIIWAFKPHPLLKSKLYLHPNWGREKANEFYDFWRTNAFSQLEQGEYDELFSKSDAMIHDSGSFLAEYLYLKKPVMYMMSPNNSKEYYSSFGIQCLEACRIGYSFDDIRNFVDELVYKKPTIMEKHAYFLKNEIDPYFKDSYPSDQIIDAIKLGIK